MRPSNLSITNKLSTEKECAHDGAPEVRRTFRVNLRLEFLISRSALIPEVARFDIQITLVEPGSAKTGLAHRNRVIGDTLALYDDTPAGQLRSYVASGKVVHPGDPVKMARAMITCADLAVAPKLLTLGRDAYELIHKSLTERLAVLEGQKTIAYSTDFVK
jgi:hypothetical protein